MKKLQDINTDMDNIKRYWTGMPTWLILGALIMFIKKKPELKSLWWYGALIMGGFAAYLGIFKPF